MARAGNQDSPDTASTRDPAGLVIGRGALMAASPRPMLACYTAHHPGSGTDDYSITVADVNSPAWDEAVGDSEKYEKEAAQLEYIIDKHNTTAGPLTSDQTDDIIDEIEAHDGFHIVEAVTAHDAREHWAPMLEHYKRLDQTEDSNG